MFYFPDHVIAERDEGYRRRIRIVARKEFVRRFQLWPSRVQTIDADVKQSTSAVLGPLLLKRILVETVSVHNFITHQWFSSHAKLRMKWW